jgi:glycosyltransferase involved in cell wall biosynthesis
VKLAQIVTYVSDDGAFGGPVAVAVAQAVELAAQGHDVELLAGWDGVARVVAPGVKVRLFKTRRLVRAGGFSGLIAPGLVNHLRRHRRSYDAVHVHMTRDLVTLPAAAYLTRKKVRLVIQSHGQIVPDARFRARVFDALAVRRVLSRASSVIAYGGVDDGALRMVSRGRASIELLVNGVVNDTTPRDAAHGAPEVLFMARLHPRKRVMVFAEMARMLSVQPLGARFAVVGPDEGELHLVRKFIAEHDLEGVLSYEGPIPYSEVRSRLRRGSVFVLPSVNEPFPVTVLDAMAVGTPCVITDTCGLAPYLRDQSAGLVTDGTPHALAEAVLRLLSDEGLRRSTVQNAHDAVTRSFSISAVATTLSSLYQGKPARK